METKEFLKQMVEETGVAGYECKVADLVRRTFADVCDDVKTDVLGNVIGLRQGEGTGRRPKVMLAGHMDEIGLMITKIDERGFLSFTQVGGVDQRTLIAQEVRILGKEVVHGIIGMKPPHLVEAQERNKAIPMRDLAIDVGLPVEKVKELISVGDVAVIDRSFVELAGETVACKAIDDRAAVAVIYECFKELKKLRHSADVYGVATVQEEVGLKGATVSTYSIEPDIGIAIDVCHAPMPGVPEQATSPMGKGPNLAFGANIHQKVYEQMVKVAKENNIPYTISPVPGGTGTDAWAIQITRAGIPTALVSLPSRYMHTSVETVNLSDIKQSGRLLAYFIASLDAAFVEGLLCY